jgi:two-component system chemotaxis response regulator CheB
MEKPKVYIIDDSLIFRAMLETMIDQDTGFEICGIAATPEQALSDLGWVLPDIILLDLNFRGGGMSGFDFLDEIDGHWHAMSVVVISTDAQHGSDTCEQAFERGATVCFDKGRVIRSGRELMELLHELGDYRRIKSQNFSHAITLPTVHH